MGCPGGTPQFRKLCFWKHLASDAGVWSRGAVGRRVSESLASRPEGCDLGGGRGSRASSVPADARELLTASCRPVTRPGVARQSSQACLVPIFLFCKEQFLKSRRPELCSSLIGAVSATKAKNNRRRQSLAERGPVLALSVCPVAAGCQAHGSRRLSPAADDLSSDRGVLRTQDGHLQPDLWVPRPRRGSEHAPWRVACLGNRIRPGHICTSRVGSQRPGRTTGCCLARTA